MFNSEDKIIYLEKEYRDIANAIDALDHEIQMEKEPFHKAEKIKRRKEVLGQLNKKRLEIKAIRWENTKTAFLSILFLAAIAFVAHFMGLIDLSVLQTPQHVKKM
eukprot:TRINITY_DN3890_c0_g1_i1.p1 TRINITY_DN3890_c0_g1~~TRINITY_DN3890_c0_g1_i1.p1  ORF type:complete len:117 (-),score=29.96 TRINITY_DN3890_c0_g1_i1:63-377(-)